MANIDFEVGNVMDMSSGLVPESVLKHNNINKRQILKPIIVPVVPRQFKFAEKSF